jgi:hypothetical protein
MFCECNFEMYFTHFKITITFYDFEGFVCYVESHADSHKPI